VKLYLVRNARPESRASSSSPEGWAGEDDLRPLDETGQRQASAIAQHLADAGITRIVSAPPLRCQQTVEQLSLQCDVRVEVDERLGAAEGPQRVLELMPAYDEGPVLFCSHRQPIESLLRLFELVDVETPISCKKGSIWTLEGPGYSPTQAGYREPLVRPGKVHFDEPRKSGAKSVRAAVLDLGSTSFNLLIAEVQRQGKIRPVVREKVMLRLGAVIATASEIPEDVAERAVQVARELHEVAEREKVLQLLSVATSALREASNGAALAERIGRALGSPVRILTGEAEARTIFRAFQKRAALGRDPVIGLDLGGGSLELALGNRDGVELEVTLPLGVARLHGSKLRNDPMKKSERRWLRERVRSALEPHRAAFCARGMRAIAAGGTIRALVRIHEERQAQRGPAPDWPKPLSLGALRRLEAQLVASTHEERLLMRGMRKRRADLLPAGAVILAEVAEILEIDRYEVSDWGLREGVLLEALCESA
jgi:exopolyphosphatase/guanosine-5'-triphosphate,3'-diphosphate pyrophosphatase